MTVTTALSPLAVQHFVDNFGNALNGGLLFTYSAGTTTKQATYTDSTGATTNTNPVVLNTRGEASVWFDVTKAYKFVLAPAGDTDPPTTPYWTEDNLNAPVAGSGSSAITQATTGFFWASAGGRIDRLTDRVFVGGAADNAGNSGLNGGDWLNGYQSAYPLDPMSLTQFAVLSDNTDGDCEVAILGGVRSLYHTNSSQSTIGVAGYAYNNNATLASGGWSFYGESYRLNDTVARSYSAELCIINQSGVTHKVNPYSAPAGATIGIQLDSGNSFGAAQQPGLSPSSAAMLFLQNTSDSSSPFETGIVVFASAVALNTNGFSEAMSLPALSGIQWYTPGTSPASFINCTTTNVTTAGQILLENAGVGITAGAANSPIALFNATSTAGVNFIEFQNGATTVSPAILAVGTDANIALVLAPQGSGATEIQSHLRPTADNTYTCGISAARWSAVYAVNGTIQTSDPTLKTDIEPLPSCLPILLDLDPYTFRWIDGGKKPVTTTQDVQEDVWEEYPDTADEHVIQSDGSVHLVTVPITRRRQMFDQVPVTRDGTPVIDTHPTTGVKTPRTFSVPRKKTVPRDLTQWVSQPGKRRHAGFMAPDVKTVLAKNGLDLGAYVLGEDGTEALRPDQLIPILWKSVQELAAAVAALKGKTP